MGIFNKSTWSDIGKIGLNNAMMPVEMLAGRDIYSAEMNNDWAKNVGEVQEQVTQAGSEIAPAAVGFIPGVGPAASLGIQAARTGINAGMGNAGANKWDPNSIGAKAGKIGASVASIASLSSGLAGGAGKAASSGAGGLGANTAGSMQTGFQQGLSGTTGVGGFGQKAATMGFQMEQGGQIPNLLNTVGTAGQMYGQANQIAQMFEEGGQMGTPQYSGGGLAAFNGPSHAEGGIPFNGNAEIEKQETVDLAEQYVYSDKLTVPGSKNKTFAKESKKYKGKETDDDITKNTNKLMLSRLRGQQEELKRANAEKEMIKLKKKTSSFMKEYGGYIDNYDDLGMYQDGGQIGGPAGAPQFNMNTDLSTVPSNFDPSKTITTDGFSGGQLPTPPSNDSIVNPTTYQNAAGTGSEGAALNTRYLPYHANMEKTGNKIVDDWTPKYTDDGTALDFTDPGYKQMHGLHNKLKGEDDAFRRSLTQLYPEQFPAYTAQTGTPTQVGLPNPNVMDPNTYLSEEQIQALGDSYTKYAKSQDIQNLYRQKAGFKQKETYGNIEGQDAANQKAGIRFLTGNPRAVLQRTGVTPVQQEAGGYLPPSGVRGGIAYGGRSNYGGSGVNYGGGHTKYEDGGLIDPANNFGAFANGLPLMDETDYMSDPYLDMSMRGDLVGQQGTPAVASGLSEIDYMNAPVQERGEGINWNQVGMMAPAMGASITALSPIDKFTANTNQEYGKALKNMKGRRYNVNPELMAAKAGQRKAAKAARQGAGGNAALELLMGRAGIMDYNRAERGALANKQNMDNQYLAQEAQMRQRLGEANASKRRDAQIMDAKAEAARNDAYMKLFDYAGMMGNLGQRNKTTADLTDILYGDLVGGDLGQVARRKSPKKKAKKAKKKS